MFYADLHSHTAYSDGTFTPRQLILRAKEIGLSGLAITDHDTVDAYAEAIPLARENGIRLGSGVEFSCSFQGTSIHLLGYDFSLETASIADLCRRHLKRRTDRNRAILQKLAEHHIFITEEELRSKASGKTIGRPHIAALMVEKGAVKSIPEAFRYYIGENKKCYVAGEPFLVQEAIDVLHHAGGKAFIAHPQLLPDKFPLADLLKLPWDGLEVYYSRLFQKTWFEIAGGKNWLMSGGSDFHGDTKPEAPLGCSGVDEATFDRIFQHALV